MTSLTRRATCLAALLFVMTAPVLASDQTDFLAKNLKQPGWKATASGLQYHVLKAHDGPWPWYPERGVVTVNYEGRLIDGTVFDSSWKRGEPASFPLAHVIKGWQEAIPMMRVGEVWEFAIPADLAYGDRRTGPIPPGSTLLFKVELLGTKSE